MIRPLLPLVLLAAMLAGCGANPAGAPERNNRPTAPANAAPNPGMPQTLPAPRTGGGGVRPDVVTLALTWGNVRTLSGKYDHWEKNNSEIETAKTTFYFQKPGKYRYEVAQSSSSIKNGSTSVFDRNTRQITSKLAGLLSVVPIKGTLDDSRAKSVRGYTLDQTDYATLTEMLWAPAADVQIVSPPGAPMVYALQQPRRFPGIEALRFTLDPQNHLPVSFEMVAQGQVVYRLHVSNLVVNPSISADKFSL